MKYFIELTLKVSGVNILVNLDSIRDIIPADDGGCKISYKESDTGDYDLWVRESYDEIIDIFHKSFHCNIVNNPDPDEGWDPFDRGTEEKNKEE